MSYQLVRDVAAEKIPVAVACRVLGFSKQAYYKWRANPVSQRDWDDAHLINAALDIHHDDAGGPGEIQKAKSSFKAAGIGFGLALWQRLWSRSSQASWAGCEVWPHIAAHPESYHPNRAGTVR